MLMVLFCLEFLTQFDKLDKDNDTQLTLSEFGMSPSLFNMLDVNNDSVITPDEVQKQIAYLQIKLETLQVSTTNTVANNKTSNVAELSTNKTETLTEATSTILSTSESQPHTKAVPSASIIISSSIIMSSSPDLDSMSVTIIPTSTMSSTTSSPTTPSIVDFEAELQKSLS